MRYFLDIVSILGFGDFVIFPSRRNTLIFQSCSLYFQEQWKHSLSSEDVGIIGQTTLKPVVHFYVDFFIFVFLNSYYHSLKLPRLYHLSDLLI